MKKLTTYTIAETGDGYEVGAYNYESNYPTTTYPSAELAAARLLQLLGVDFAVSPQTHPERICMGDIE